MTPLFEEDVLSVPPNWRKYAKDIVKLRDKKNTSGVSSLIPIETMLKDIAPFDADIWKPMDATWYTGSTDGGLSKDYEKDEVQFDYTFDTYNSFDCYRRKLDGQHEEDIIDPSHIIYGWLDWNIRKFIYRSNMEYTKEHAIQNNIAINDDGDILLDADQVSMCEDRPQLYTAADIDEMSNALCYKIQRVFKIGTAFRTCFISMCKAYLKAVKSQEIARREALQNGKSSTYMIKINQIITEGVDSLDLIGNREEQYRIEQKSNNMKNAYYCFMGYLPKYTSYYKDIQSIMSLCKKLNIDLTKTDLSKLDWKYVYKLCPNYITSNRTYLLAKDKEDAGQRQLSRMDEVYETIKRLNGFRDFGTIMEIEEKFYSRIDVDAALDENLYKFKQYLKEVKHKYADEDLTVVNGIYYIDNAQGCRPIVINLKGIYRAEETLGIVSETGLVFAVTTRGLSFISFEMFYVLYAKVRDGATLTVKERDYWFSAT